MSQSNLYQTRFVRGERVYLCGIEESDLDAIYAWKNDLALLAQILARPVPVSRHEVQEWHRANLSDKNQVLLGIHACDTNALVGVARLMFIDWLARTSELGMWIGSTQERGKGLGSEALALLIDYAFGGLNLRRIHLRVAESNAAAIACYRRAGFVQEGVLREHVWVSGKYENVVQMGLLHREYR